MKITFAHKNNFLLTKITVNLKSDDLHQLADAELNYHAKNNVEK